MGYVLSHPGVPGVGVRTEGKKLIPDFQEYLRLKTLNIEPSAYYTLLNEEQSY